MAGWAAELSLGAHNAPRNNRLERTVASSPATHAAIGMHGPLSMSFLPTTVSYVEYVNHCAVTAFVDVNVVSIGLLMLCLFEWGQS